MDDAVETTMNPMSSLGIVLGALLVAAPVWGASPDLPLGVPLAPPLARPISAGPLGDAIRYGQQIVNATPITAKAFIGNGLNCASCHIDGGRTAEAAPFVGLTGLFPEYGSRRGRVESLEERINDCFRRSMNGKPLPSDSREMIGLLAYIAWLSHGVPIGVEVKGRGFRDIRSPAPPDPVHGKELYAQKCAACHGAGGAGRKGAGGVYMFPPLWGPQSFNVGAGMARISVAAAFVQAKMPLGNAGALTDQEAYDIAAYFTAQPRPGYSGTTDDWPSGGRPADAR
jgi:thiosulfate dehydrogenase